LSGRYDKLPFVARPDKLKLIGHQTSVCRAATTSFRLSNRHDKLKLIGHQTSVCRAATTS
jgi:hypothetical protein